MKKDYRLYELNDEEFEDFVIRLCLKWLGQGVTPFATGKDGGRDGKFHGKAQSYPSTSAPHDGHFVLQAKHVSAPNQSCSDADFERLLKKEHPKIKRLIKEGICDHYIVFTNRKLTGGADEKLMKALLALGLKSAAIIGVEKLHVALDGDADLRESLPNRKDKSPFGFEPADLIEVIGAFHDYTKAEGEDGFDSAHDFKKISLKSEKNKMNGLSTDYYQEIIVKGSMPYFHRIEAFLKNPRNEDFKDLYHDAADELKQKILVNRSEFETFDDVFAFLYEEVQKQREALKGKRRLISILLHYMYSNCDIGSKHVGEEPLHVEA